MNSNLAVQKIHNLSLLREVHKGRKHVKPLRLAIVAERFWPRGGGLERSLGRWASALAERGCSVTLLTVRWQPGWPEQIVWRNVPVVRLGPPPVTWWTRRKYLQALVRWLRVHEDEMDLIYVSRLRHEAAAVVAAMGRRRPVILQAETTGRCGDCFWQIEASGGRGIKRACLRAAAFVAPTPPIEAELQAAGYPRDRIHLMPPGVAPPEPRTVQSRQDARSCLAEANAALAMADWAPLAVGLGSPAAGRGWASLVASWPTLIRRWPNLRLWLPGETADREAVGQQIQAQGLVGRAALIGTFDEPEVLLRAAEVAVAPSVEGSPHEVLEAMAAGLPVVASDVAVHRWLLADGRLGLLVPDDPVAWSEAVARVLDEPRWAAALGLAAQEHVARHFSLAQRVDQQLAWFDRLRQ